MKVVDCREKKACCKPTGYIPVGTTFQGTLSDITGTFLMGYDGIVCLSQPQHTWRKSDWEARKEDIENYCKVRTEVHILADEE